MASVRNEFRVACQPRKVQTRGNHQTVSTASSNRCVDFFEKSMASVRLVHVHTATMEPPTYFGRTAAARSTSVAAALPFAAALRPLLAALRPRCAAVQLPEQVVNLTVAGQGNAADASLAGGAAAPRSCTRPARARGGGGTPFGTAAVVAATVGGISNTRRG